MKKQQSGFTLIELVLVIVILGILAATALPRFSDLSKDARVATVTAMLASIKTGATVAHAMQLARGQASNAVLTYEGTTTVAMANSYPTAAAAGIGNTLDPGYTTDFTLTGQQFRKNGAPDSTTCYVEYAASVGGSFPATSVVSSGC